jgi:poly(3-hydroxyalkanoate) synthetase
MSKEVSKHYTSKSVISYNGKKKDISSFKEKHWLAKVKNKRNKEVILDSLPMAKHFDLLEEKLKICMLNDFVNSNLVLSMDNTKEAGGKVAFNILRRNKSQDYPNRNAAVAWQALKRKYAPQ